MGFLWDRDITQPRSVRYSHRFRSFTIGLVDKVRPCGSPVIPESNPHRPGFARLDCLLDKLHTSQAVIDSRKTVFLKLKGLAVSVSSNRINDSSVNRSEGL